MDFSVKDGKLYYMENVVGDSIERPGFEQYVFDDTPLGEGANGITFGVTHKILGVRQVVKIYIPKDDENDIILKAKEESIKNANTTLRGIVAVTFDAGEYCFPCRLWYSVMESVNSYATIKDWRVQRNIYFTSNDNKFDVSEPICLSSIHTSINLAAGLLQAVIGLYDNDVIHGDLNPGNILWILEKGNLKQSLRYYSSYSYACLGNLEPFAVKLIDMGASRVNNYRDAGIYRDSFKLYEHIKSLLSPLFSSQKYRFDEWLNFQIFETSELEEYGVSKICGVKGEEGKIFYIRPSELAGDFFRLICVMTIALGIITNSSDDSITLTQMDNCDFYVLMFKGKIDDAIKAFSFDSMITLQKMDKLDSTGRLINWEKFWMSYPFDRIDISRVMKAKKEAELHEV